MTDGGKQLLVLPGSVWREDGGMYAEEHSRTWPDQGVRPLPVPAGLGNMAVLWVRRRAARDPGGA